MNGQKLRAYRALARAKQYVLVTPEEAIMEGQISDDFEGFLQISALHQVTARIESVIKQWEKKHHVGNGRRGSKSRPDNKTKARK